MGISIGTRKYRFSYIVRKGNQIYTSTVRKRSALSRIRRHLRQLPRRRHKRNEKALRSLLLKQKKFSYKVLHLPQFNYNRSLMRHCRLQ